MAEQTLPMQDRPIDQVAGHWLLARLGKRVLRPGGLELTTWLLEQAQLYGKDVIEFAPGLGKTASLIVEDLPRSYRGVDEDPHAAALVAEVTHNFGQVYNAKAQDTGLEEASADVVIGEAMLTMQGEKGKNTILQEANRLLRPGGIYAIHELALEPDTLSDEQKTEIRQALARSIHVNARPLTTAEWTELFEANGFEVLAVNHAPMALLEPKRNIQDEGWRVLKIMGNLLRYPKARKRVLAMRKVFTQYQDELAGIALIARKVA